ncbi:MAG TPA: FAD-dependent oxidoreductase [Candidatus Obscuribacterales bacterium]
MKTRRDFLKVLFTCLAAGEYPLSIQAAQAATGEGSPENAHGQAGKTAAKQASQPGRTLNVSEWFGDDFTIGHRFRNGEVPKDFPQQPERTLDFVIVGGGIGGLSAAHYLKDHNVLLLEQYNQLGGQARGGFYKSIGFSYGAAYVSNVDGIYGKLYEELGIKPEKLPAGDNTFFWNQKWYQGITGPDKDALYENFKLLMAAMSSTRKTLPEADTPQAMSGEALEKLDSIPLAATLKNCSQEFLQLVDSICKASTCATTANISAAAGYYLLEDLRSDNYCFKGGNPAISRALVEKINASGGDRLQQGTFVWQIKLNENGADVFYTSKDGQAHHVACKHVIVATPHMLSWRLISNLNDSMKLALMPFQYGSYMVANFLLTKKIFKGAYDNFVNTSHNFADFVISETPYEIAGKQFDNASVLTVYQPWEPGTAGRPLLLQGERQALAKVVNDDLSQLIEHLDDHLYEIVLSRWGHAMAVPSTGYYSRLRKIYAAYDGPYSLAHCSTQGIPCAEAAIRAGKFAAERARSMSTKTSMVVPLTINKSSG